MDIAHFKEQRVQGGIIRNATVRKRIQKTAHDAISGSEDLYRDMFYKNKAIKLLIDPASGKIIDANDAACEFYQYAHDDIIRLRIWDINTLGKKETVRRMAKVMNDEQTDFLFQHRLASGEIRQVMVYSGIIETKGKKLLHSIVQDVTDRIKAEESIKESEERFKALHDASFGGIAIHDKGLILECNKGLSKITGYAYDELIGMTVLNLISDDTRDNVARYFETGDENPYEATGVRKNGERYPLHLEARNIPYRGKNAGVVEFRDISETKRGEKEREELEEKLRQAQKMEAVGRLAGGVAHDFNNMLNVVIGHVDMALEEMDPSQPIYKRLQEIRKAGERSSALTRQLLAFARKQTVSPEVLDLNRTLENMTTMLRRLMGEDIDLAWHPGENVWPVKMDPSQIDQILANLCVNARDAIADVGRVTIETGNASIEEAYCRAHPGFNPGEYAFMAVSDNGCGMDEETMESIFEPFFTTKESGKGTGLGLATVYGVVRQNGGFIDVCSEPGRGTTFHIYLPRYRATSEIMPEKVKTPPTGPGHETILLVEDDTAVLRMTAQMLQRLGYWVFKAGTPAEAISLAREHAGAIHLLVTDLVMPEMNGLDLARRLLSICPDLKRLFMSGYTADVIARHGVLDRGIDFIQKPFSMEQFGVKIREVLDKVTVQRSEKI